MVTRDELAVQARIAAREVLHFLPDAVSMLRGVLTDDRVPRQAKREVGAALAFLVSPLDRVLSVIPVVGQVDNAAVMAFAVRRLMAAAGEPVLRDHWRGSERGFQALLRGVRVISAPSGVLRKAALAGGVLQAAQGLRRGRGYSGRTVDGTVVR